MATPVANVLLDPQIPMEKACTPPAILRERLGRELDAANIAAYDADQFEALFRTPRDLHRLPAATAKHVHDLAPST
jgi:hypothetical protein